jgi:hypothetical protein
MVASVVPTSPGTAQQRHLQIERRQGLIVGHDRVDAAHGLEQRLEHGPAADHDARAAGSQQWSVADELDRVAEALLAPEQDRAPGRVAAVPARLRVGRGLAGHAVAVPAPLVLRPALGEAPGDQKARAERQVRLGAAGVELDRSPGHRGRFVEPAEIVEGRREIAPRHHVAGSQLEHSPIRVVRRREIAQPRVGHPEIVHRLVIRRPQRDRAPEGRDGVLRRAGVEARLGEVEPGFGPLGIELGGAPIRRQRLVEASGLAERGAPGSRGTRRPRAGRRSPGGSARRPGRADRIARRARPAGAARPGSRARARAPRGTRPRRPAGARSGAG